MRQKTYLSRVKRNSDLKLEASAIEGSMTKATHVTSYIFGAPKPYKTASYVIILSLIAGILINFDVSYTFDNFLYSSGFINALILGLIIIALPALISGLITTPLAEILGGVFYLRRSFLLAFMSCIILIIVILLGKILRVFFVFDFIIIIIFGYALIFGVRHSVILATSDHRNLNSILCSINQTLVGFLFLWFIPGLGFTIGTSELFYMFWFSVIFLITTLLWIQIITKPFKRNFGVNGLVLMKHALTQFTKATDTYATQMLENEFFEKIGSKSDLRVGVVCIRENARPEKHSPPLKTLMVIPSVHPGPFGILAGSNLPTKLSKYLKDLTTNLMVFHGPASHDQNPVSTLECEKVAKKVRKLVRETTYSDKISTFERATLGKNDGSPLNICAQRFSNGIVYVHTSSPESTDDIHNTIGEAIIRKGESETKSKALFIDAHNCLEIGTGEVFFGSTKANNMLKLVSKLNNSLPNSPLYKLSTGYADDKTFSVSQGFGPMGIQVMVIKCDPVDRTVSQKSRIFAYILLDGNNIVPGLRERLRSAIINMVDDAEIFTSDNHIVNATMGGYNPVGLKLEPKTLVKRVIDLVKKAKSDISPSEVGMNSGMVKNIKILGQNTPMRLSSTINSTISIMGSSMTACQALALSLCWLITFL